MSLHRALRSDWSAVAPQERNIWQRWAAVSHGVFTPGNIISVTGGALVIWGLVLLSRNGLITGSGAIIIGRLCDLLDGLVAEHTKTKSPLGEFVDATIDKILIVLALFVLVNHELIPIAVGTLMFIHAAYMIGLATIARDIKAPLHPSRSGKLATAFEWLSVALYMFAAILKQQNYSSLLTSRLAFISFLLFIFAALWSTRNYTRYIYYKKKMRP